MGESVEALLAELVAVDTTSTRPNAPLLDVVEPRLAALGFACERLRYRDDAGAEKANLVARLGRGPAALALVGHTDCVPFDAGWADALRLTERGGALYGRGACDTKGFIAAALTAVARLGGRVDAPLVLALTADEELGCEGAKKLVEARAFECARAIVGEPTSLTPVRSTKGYCLAEVEVQGREGHSAYPEAGASAIFAAAELVARVEAYAREVLPERRDDAFPPPHATVNVGLISGGRARNVIPGACRFSLEWRPLPGQPADEVLRAVQAMAAGLARGPVRAAVRPVRLEAGFSTPPDADVVRLLEELCGRRAATAAFGTEGPQLAQLGAQPVVFGPGDIAVAHATGEHVGRAELARTVDILEAAVRRFCLAAR